MAVIRDRWEYIKFQEGLAEGKRQRRFEELSLHANSRSFALPLKDQFQEALRSDPSAARGIALYQEGYRSGYRYPWDHP